MNDYINMNRLRPGQNAVIMEINVKGSMHRRFLDIGLIKGTKIECIGRSPSGDPSAYLIRGAVIAIRSENCSDILVQLC